MKNCFFMNTATFNYMPNLANDKQKMENFGLNDKISKNKQLFLGFVVKDFIKKRCEIRSGYGILILTIRAVYRRMK